MAINDCRTENDDVLTVVTEVEGRDLGHPADTLLEDLDSGRRRSDLTTTEVELHVRCHGILFKSVEDQPGMRKLLM